MLSFWINIWDKQKKKQHNLTNCGRTKQAGVIACSVDAAILQVTQSFGWMCSRAEQCIRFVAAPTPFRCQNRLQSRALAAKEPKTVINQELDYVTGKKKGVRVIYILHKTLSPLKMDAAEPTGDRRLRSWHRVSPRRGMWNTGQRPAVQSSTTYIYIYYTGQKNAGLGEVSKTYRVI